MTVVIRSSILVAALFVVAPVCFAADYDCPETDVNGDCVVDFRDIAALALQWLDGPTCPADYENCDANSVNGCEAHLLTSYHNCGACGISCADFPGTYCSDGNCVELICPNKWADCDSDPNNGCETNLALYTKPCNAPHDFGLVKGDVGSDQVQYTGHGSRWFRIILLEADPSGDVDISVDIQLDSPPGTDYNMDIYRDGCPGSGTHIFIGDSPGDDGGCLCWDDWPYDQSMYIYIRIYVQSGTSCDDYTLTVTGNTGCGFCM